MEEEEEKENSYDLGMIVEICQWWNEEKEKERWGVSVVICAPPTKQRGRSDDATRPPERGAQTHRTQHDLGGSYRRDWPFATDKSLNI